MRTTPRQTASPRWYRRTWHHRSVERGALILFGGAATGAAAGAFWTGDRAMFALCLIAVMICVIGVDLQSRI